jgi:hypothetical protein
VYVADSSEHYLSTPSFVYIATQLYNKGVTVYAIEKSAKASSDYWNVVGSGTSKLQPTQDMQKYVAMIANYSDNYSEDNKLILEDEFKLTNQTQSGVASVTAILNNGGDLSLLTWRPASGYVTVGGYYLYENGVKTISLTYDEAKAKLSDREFITNYMFGVVDIRCEITIEEVEGTVNRLTFDVDLNGNRYARVFIIPKKEKESS